MHYACDNRYNVERSKNVECIRFLIEAAADAYMLDIEYKVSVNATMPLWSMQRCRYGHDVYIIYMDMHICMTTALQ